MAREATIVHSEGLSTIRGEAVSPRRGLRTERSRAAGWYSYDVMSPGYDYPTVKFTSKERDSETGLDFFGARYMSSAEGRFTSPDRPFVDQHPQDPQSWNLYAYVRSNPLALVDPSGLACVVGPGGTETDDKSGGQSCADAHKAENNNQASATANAQAPTVRDLAAEAAAEHIRMLWAARQGQQAQDVPLTPLARQVFSQPAITSLPIACGGGVYGYLGQEVGGGPVNGFVGSIAEIDSEHGPSAGGLAEVGAGEGVVGGVGGAATVGANGQVTSEGLVYGGLGAHTPLISASAGGVAFGHGPSSVTGAGIYGEAFLLKKGGGAGLYMNLSTVGKGCQP